ncbi:MAG: hypothetical protein WC881_09380, partial [Elusimicrobiota bacterium]
MDGRWLPGYRSVSDAAARKALENIWGRPVPPAPGLSAPAIMQSAGSGAFSALLSWGDNGLDGTDWGGAFVAAAEWVKPGPRHPAQVAFPAALFLEDEGCLTSWDRRVQALPAVLE